jgi:hypothetical protein
MQERDRRAPFSPGSQAKQFGCCRKETHRRSLHFGEWEEVRCEQRKQDPGTET